MLQPPRQRQRLVRSLEVIVDDPPYNAVQVGPREAHFLRPTHDHTLIRRRWPQQVVTSTPSHYHVPVSPQPSNTSNTACPCCPCCRSCPSSCCCPCHRPRHCRHRCVRTGRVLVDDLICTARPLLRSLYSRYHRSCEARGRLLYNRPARCCASTPRHHRHPHPFVAPDVHPALLPHTLLLVQFSRVRRVQPPHRPPHRGRC